MSIVETATSYVDGVETQHLADLLQNKLDMEKRYRGSKTTIAYNEWKSAEQAYNNEVNRLLAHHPKS